MSGMKEKAVALLVDVVSSRTGDREVLHEAVLDAARATNEAALSIVPLEALQECAADAPDDLSELFD